MGKPKGPFARWAIRNLSHPLEAALLGGFWKLCGLLPLDVASNLGGRIGRTVGPFLPGDGTARRNLALVMPELDGAARDRIVAGMWDNLGRTLAEYPHLAQIVAERIDVVGRDVLAEMRDDGRGGFFVGGHFANWEAPVAYALSFGLDFALVYRAPNNRFVDRLLRRFRGAPANRQIPKGPDGSRLLMRALGEGAHVGMLVDQKLNDGIASLFFGRPAMTAPATARLALRRKLPAAPIRIERLGGARFRLTVFPPVGMPADDTAENVAALTRRFNDIVEEWVRERPEQWLWLHRRWPESK